MASNPMDRCCVVGVKHEGTPKGEFKKIGDIRTYFSYPKSGSTQNALIIMTDVLGVDFPNIKLIADQFAANGYFAVIPDVFNGNEVPFPIPASYNLKEYMATKMPRPPQVDAIYDVVLKHLRTELGAKKVGGVGYCFGGKYVCRWMKEGGLDAGYTAHPSFVDADEVRGVKGPISITAAETDAIFSVEKRRETEEILREIKVPYQIFLFSDTEHGFAVKGDLSSPKQRFAKEQAFLQAVNWFDEFIKKE